MAEAQAVRDYQRSVEQLHDAAARGDEDGMRKAAHQAAEGAEALAQLGYKDYHIRFLCNRAIDRWRRPHRRKSR